MSAMVEMSRVIRETVERYGSTLHDLDNKTLLEFQSIVGAFYYDLCAEQQRRIDAADEA